MQSLTFIIVAFFFLPFELIKGVFFFDGQVDLEVLIFIFIDKVNVFLMYLMTMYFCFSDEMFMPLIPLGLKETKEIDFRDPFKVSNYVL